MGDKTAISWTDSTWNPVRGCSRVSPGCDNCYAIGQAHRFDTPEEFEDQDPVNGIRELSKRAGPYHGLTTIRRGKVDWTGVARFVPEMLDQPLRWKRPRRIFVNSMSDLFHESLTYEQIAAVFGVMAACPRHTFQVLTKRPKRAREWFEWVHLDRGHEPGKLHVSLCDAMQGQGDWDPNDRHCEELLNNAADWPLENVWLGVSAENQEQADKRLPDLLACPAAVRFVSAEPLLGPLDLSEPNWLGRGDCDDPACCTELDQRGIDWVIVGGESGHGARPSDLEWHRSIIRQCKEAGVAVFEKQLGGNVFAPWKLRWDERLDSSLDLFSIDGVGAKGANFATVWTNGSWHTWDANGTGENSACVTMEEAKRQAIEALARQHVHPVKGWARHPHMLRHPKGGDPSEWPLDLRVQEFPDA